MPGDVVLLDAGDRIPADARVIEVVDMKTDEAILTGESTAVAKKDVVLGPKTAVADRKNSLFMARTLPLSFFWQGSASPCCHPLHGFLKNPNEFIIILFIRQQKTPAIFPKLRRAQKEAGRGIIRSVPWP